MPHPTQPRLFWRQSLQPSTWLDTDNWIELCSVLRPHQHSIGYMTYDTDKQSSTGKYARLFYNSPEPAWGKRLVQLDAKAHRADETETN